MFILGSLSNMIYEFLENIPGNVSLGDKQASCSQNIMFAK